MGKLFIFSAPSGAGKTSIVRALLKKGMNLEFSISACNREKRDKEKHGKDYYFFSTSEFREKIEHDEFLEWEEVYPGKYYGTLKSEPERIWKKGNHVLFDVDVVGGINIKNLYKERALSVFIMPPSINELKCRLISRNTDSPKAIEKRVAKAQTELQYAEKFDKIVVNEELDIAIAQAYQLIKDFMSV